LGKVKLYNTLKQCEEFILGHTKCQAW
jgi:hypothetical protein